MSKDISLTQKDRRCILRKVIINNTDNGESGTPEELIIEIMTEEYSFSKDEIVYDMNKLGRESGKIYEPRPKEFARL